MKILTYLACVVIVAALAGSYVGNRIGRNAEPRQAFSERAREICAREFGSMGEEAVTDCRYKLTVREALAQKDRQDNDDLRRMDTLYREAR